MSKANAVLLGTLCRWVCQICAHNRDSQHIQGGAAMITDAECRYQRLGDSYRLEQWPLRRARCIS